MNVRINPTQDLAAVEAVVNYLLPTNERPRLYARPPGTRTAVGQDPHVLRIRDARPIAASLSLDEHGFELIHHDTAVQNFYDNEEVKAVYYPEVEQALKRATGADRVFIFEHTTRRGGVRDNLFSSRQPGVEDLRAGSRPPASRVHVDNTAKSGPQRVRELLPSDADALLRGRVQIINLWRPIRGPLRDSPLALCDASTVAFGDLVPSDLILPDRRVIETYQVTYNPAHRWFYVPEMQTNEAVLLKCYDSEVDGRARFAPHGAFIDPTAPEDAPPRESIEVRTVVFHKRW
jgi:hypothetical protein